MAFCKCFFNRIKCQSGPYTLRPPPTHRRHYRAKLVYVKSLVTEVLFVRFYVTETLYYNTDYG